MAPPACRVKEACGWEERLSVADEFSKYIASDRETLPLTEAQKAELDRRLAAYEADGNRGRPADEVIPDIRRRLSVAPSR